MPKPNKQVKRDILPVLSQLAKWQKKIDDQENRARLQKVLEKRQAAKSKAKSTEDPKDIPKNAVNGNEASENSKK